MPENFANRYQTTLASGVTSGATTGTATSVTGVPAVPFRAIISAEGANTDEIVLVTGRSGTTLTWTRAAEAVAGVQVASAHGIGATFTAIVTATGLLSLPGWYDVRVYGAVGDGVADDTAAIVAAIAAVPTPTVSGEVMGGGTVYFPAGTYKVTTTIALRTNVSLVGDGSHGSMLVWAGAAATHMFSATGVYNMTIRDLQLRGTMTGGRVGYGLLLDGAFSNVFRNVTFAYLERGVTLTNNSGDNNFNSCWARLCTVGVLANSLMNHWTGGSFIDCVTGVTNTAYGGLKFANTTFSGTAAVRNIDLAAGGDYSFYSVWFEGSTTSVARLGNGSAGPAGTTFQSCHFHTTGTYNLDLQSGGSKTVVIGCDFDTPAAVLIGATHTRAVFIANFSLIGGTITITDNATDAYVHAVGTANFIDHKTAEIRGGVGANPLVIAGQATSGTGVDFRVKNNVAADTTWVYVTAGGANPIVVLPLHIVAQGMLEHTGTTAGFYSTSPIAKPTGVAVTAAGIHAALVALGLIGA